MEGLQKMQIILISSNAPSDSEISWASDNVGIRPWAHCVSINSFPFPGPTCRFSKKSNLLCRGLSDCGIETSNAGTYLMLITCRTFPLMRLPPEILNMVLSSVYPASADHLALRLTGRTIHSLMACTGRPESRDA